MQPESAGKNGVFHHAPFGSIKRNPAVFYDD